MLRVASSHTHDLACSRYSVRLSSLCDACNDAAWCDDDDDTARDPCNDNADNDDDNNDDNDDDDDNNNDGNDDNNDDDNNADNNNDDNDDDDRIPLSLKLLSKYSRARYIFLLVLWTLSLV